MMPIVYDHQQMVNKLVKPPSQIIDEIDEAKANLMHMSMGIAGEAGEIIDAVKKFTIYNMPIDRDNLIEELGDIEFYLEGLRQVLGVTREETLEHNLEKLAKRYRDYEYSNDSAKNRLDKAGPDEGV